MAMLIVIEADSLKTEIAEGNISSQSYVQEHNIFSKGRNEDSGLVTKQMRLKQNYYYAKVTKNISYQTINYCMPPHVISYSNCKNLTEQNLQNQNYKL